MLVILSLLICHLSFYASHQLKIGRKLPFSMSSCGRQKWHWWRWDCFVWQNPSISLVFHSLNCSSRASSRGCNLYIVCLYVCEWGLSWDGEQWSMRVNYDDRSFYATSIVTTWVWGCVYACVFLICLSTFLFKCSLPAHYGNNEDSPHCTTLNECGDSTLPVYYYNLIPTHKRNGWFQIDLSWPKISSCVCH